MRCANASLFLIGRARQVFRHSSQIVDEQPFGSLSLAARRAEHGRRMHCGEHRVRPWRFDGDSALLHDAEGRAEERLCGDGSETKHDRRSDDGDLLLEPRKTRAHLGGIRGLVQSPNAAGVSCPLEVLHRVGEIHILTIDAGRFERAIEQLSRRPHEWTSGSVFGIAKLRQRRVRRNEISGRAGWLHCSSPLHRAVADLRAADGVR